MRQRAKNVASDMDSQSSHNVFIASVSAMSGQQAGSVGCGDAGHHKARATPSENLGKAPFRSRARLVG